MTKDTISAGADKGVTPATHAVVPIDRALFRDLKVHVEAKLGRTELTVEKLMALKTGSVVTLETGLADHVDIYVNDSCVARGEIVAVGDHFGVRITELASEK
jgi:flagellar motor switch protein FliN